MKILRFILSSSRFLANFLVVFSFVSVVVGAGSISYQDKKEVRKTHGNAISILTYTEIPEATEPCTPEEAEWWKQIRQAGNDLYKKSDKKSKARFLLLLQEGQQKAYRIPLKDRPQQMLIFPQVILSESVQRLKISGKVDYSVECRSDGSVGDVKMIKGLAVGIDENVIRAVRQQVFLPAIENGAFVTTWSTGKTEFSLARK
jgi:hypothetical protein